MTKEIKKYNTYNALAHHPFVTLVLDNAVKVYSSIVVTGSVLKVEAQYSRDPTLAEFYCIQTGQTLAQFLNICEQL